MVLLYVIAMDLNRLTNEAYNAYVKGKAKPSPMGEEPGGAFLVGGGSAWWARPCWTGMPASAWT